MLVPYSTRTAVMTGLGAMTSLLSSVYRGHSYGMGLRNLAITSANTFAAASIYYSVRSSAGPELQDTLAASGFAGTTAGCVLGLLYHGPRGVLRAAVALGLTGLAVYESERLLQFSAKYALGEHTAAVPAAAHAVSVSTPPAAASPASPLQRFLDDWKDWLPIRRLDGPLPAANARQRPSTNPTPSDSGETVALAAHREIMSAQRSEHDDK